jgi:hypothetical protein
MAAFWGIAPCSLAEVERNKYRKERNKQGKERKKTMKGKLTERTIEKSA